MRAAARDAAGRAGGAVAILIEPVAELAEGRRRQWRRLAHIVDAPRRHVDAARAEEFPHHLLIGGAARKARVLVGVARRRHPEHAPDLLVGIDAGIGAVLAGPSALDASRGRPHLAARAGVGIIGQQRVGGLAPLPVAAQVAVDGGVGYAMQLRVAGDQLAAPARFVDVRLVPHQRFDDGPGARAQGQVLGRQALVALQHQVRVGGEPARPAAGQVLFQRRHRHALHLGRCGVHVEHAGIATVGGNPQHAHGARLRLLVMQQVVPKQHQRPSHGHARGCRGRMDRDISRAPR